MMCNAVAGLPPMSDPAPRGSITGTSPLRLGTPMAGGKCLVVDLVSILARH